MGDGFQQHISVLVSQSVVDMLEIIQIQVQQSTFSAGLFCLVDLSCQISLTAHTVIESRQKIRIRLLLNTALV